MELSSSDSGTRVVSADTSKPETSNSLPKALVVDDHQDSAEVLGMMLRTLGYEFQIADNGIDALKKAFDLKPNLILLDVCMPKLDGYDTCRVIRTQPWGNKVRLVAVTGQEPESVQHRSEKAGFDAYLIKPVEFETLKKIVGATEQKNAVL